MKLVKKVNVGVQTVYNTNVDKYGNYISNGNIINKNCIIDSDYEGEIHINIHNVGNTSVAISAGEKIIQAIIYKIELAAPLECASLEALYSGKNSVRGTGGFGSTGTK